MKGNETGRKAGPQGSETALKITAISLLPMGRLDYLPEENDDLTKTLNQLWSAAVRRRWWILLPACGVALGTILVSILLPNRYRSEATILVEPQKVPERYVVANTTLDIKDALQAMTETVLSRTRLLQAIDEFGLYAKKRDLCLPKTSFALNQLKLTSSGC